MKHTFLILALVASTGFGATLRLPVTMDSGSVQAKLKGLLFEKLEKEGPLTEKHSARLTGSYSRVTLEDDRSKIVCREFSAGMLAVQQFECEVSTRLAPAGEVPKLNFPQTMDAGSVQAFLKNVLFEKLEADGPVTSEWEANLTGSYSRVTLEDKQSKVVCREHPAGRLAVQTFGCNFDVK